MYVTAYRYDPATTNAHMGAWANGAVITAEHRTKQSAAKFVRELLAEAKEMGVEIQWYRTNQISKRALLSSGKSY